MIFPTISVVMPAYNGEKYLREAIDSILDQTYKNFEFIILNDGSTDNTEEIILSYDDPRIVYVRNEENLQIVKTLNKGIDLAKGKYIARMDADDIAYKDRLKTQVKFMDTNLEVAVCGCLMDSTDNSQLIYKFPFGEIANFHLLYGPPVAHPTVMIRRSILTLNNLFYDETIKYAEDYDLWSRIAKVAKIDNIPRVLVSYRTHSNQISQSKAIEQHRDANIIRRRELSHIGISVSDKFLAIHVDFFRCKSAHDIEMLELYLEWFRRLVDSNNAKTKFDPDTFRKYLLRKLWVIFSNSTHLGVYAIKDSFKHHFFCNKVCSVKEMLVFFLKCIMPRFSRNT